MFENYKTAADRFQYMLYSMCVLILTTLVFSKSSGDEFHIPFVDMDAPRDVVIVILFIVYYAMQLMSIIHLRALSLAWNSDQNDDKVRMMMQAYPNIVNVGRNWRYLVISVPMILFFNVFELYRPFDLRVGVFIVCALHSPLYFGLYYWLRIRFVGENPMDI